MIAETWMNALKADSAWSAHAVVKDSTPEENDSIFDAISYLKVRDPCPSPLGPDCLDSLSPPLRSWHCLGLISSHRDPQILLTRYSFL